MIKGFKFRFLNKRKGFIIEFLKRIKKGFILLIEIDLIKGLITLIYTYLFILTISITQYHNINKNLSFCSN